MGPWPARRWAGPAAVGRCWAGLAAGGLLAVDGYWAGLAAAGRAVGQAVAVGEWRPATSLAALAQAEPSGWAGGGRGRIGGRPSPAAARPGADPLYDAILIHAFIVTGVQLGRYGPVPVVITSRQFTSLLVAIP